LQISPSLVAAQARLPEIEELQKQITASCEELAELDFRATEERVAAAAREAAVKVRHLSADDELWCQPGKPDSQLPALKRCCAASSAGESRHGLQWKGMVCLLRPYEDIGPRKQ